MQQKISKSMASATYQENLTLAWETVSQGVTCTILRAEPGEKRVLIKIEAGRTCSHHAHATADGSEGCTILVWKSGK